MTSRRPGPPPAVRATGALATGVLAATAFAVALFAVVVLAFAAGTKDGTKDGAKSGTKGAKRDARPAREARDTRPSRATPPAPAAPPKPVPSTTPADPVREAYQRATAPALGDTSLARLRAFVARVPRHPLAREAWLELGTLAYAQGEYAQARDDFRRARGGAVVDRARLWEARAQLALGAPREARALAQPIARAKRGTAYRWEAGEIVALSLMNEGKRAAALASYRELLDTPPGPGEPAALFQAIELANETGAEEDAREWRDRLVRRYARSPEAATARAVAANAPSSRETRDQRDQRGDERDARTKP